MTSPSQPISSVFNDGYVMEAYEAWRRDPASVDESWRQFFRFAESLGGAAPRAQGAAADPDLLRKTAAAAALVQGIRQFGHLAVPIDPLGTPPLGAPELTPGFYGITEADLAEVPAAALGFTDGRFRTATEVVAMLRRRYATNLGIEYAHISDGAEREWFRTVMREEQLTRPLAPDEKRRTLERLTQVDGLERFLALPSSYGTKKRFSIEGTDALVPMLDVATEEAARLGAREVVVGMAHRGRLNVLTNFMGKPYEKLFAEFEGRHAETNAESGTGDVKYHMGYRSTRRLADGTVVQLVLSPNPSHLEFVAPVVNGMARADQRVEGQPGERDETRVLTVAVHGDAAFIGEGVVAETFNMSLLRGYRVGGTLHIITNNQVGFTTDPIDARSTHYASDLAKGFDVPVVHVNADDVESCVAAVRIGIAYRRRFGKDFLIDLVGYRRRGHNEGEEPAFTQPQMYDAIRAHPTPRQVYGARLVQEGVATQEEVDALDRAFGDRLAGLLQAVRGSDAGAHEVHDSPEGEPASLDGAVDTAVPAEELRAINEALLRYPEGFTPHPRLARVLERRREALEHGGVDWAHAEALAFGTLVRQGTSVRLTGQDAERATFGQRNAVLHDVQQARTYTPLAHLPGAAGAFEVYNSPLSETAVMAFEYGFSVEAVDALTLWEAQFGDFVNVAQPIIDQYISADRSKWGQDTGLTLLLPHGYEGQGPEHSSARLERFLQLCAEGNMTVANCTTPAQYYHVLRRQALRRPRRPLVLATPKSLLRLPEASSRIEELATGRFQPVLDDAAAAGRREAVMRLVLCTGKVYYDLAKEHGDAEHVALVRVEELYPWPADALTRVLDQYPHVTEVVWVQEEPRNMGAWAYAAPRLRGITGTRLPLRYVGRPDRASPAEGYEAAHKEEQARLVAEAVAPASEGAARPAAKERKQKQKA